jgi:hypothetical protein
MLAKKLINASADMSRIFFIGESIWMYIGVGCAKTVSKTYADAKI